MVRYDKMDFKMGRHVLSLNYSPDLFMPNATTRLFSKAVKITKDSVVYDIGTGVGPIAIWAALEGAKEAHAVDIIPEHLALARINVYEHGLEEKIHLYLGNLFSPLKGKADIIISDVSGVADIAGRALGWYTNAVPVGGENGTKNIVEIIQKAPERLNADGVLYFPSIISFSDHKKTMEAALRTFQKVEQMFPKHQPLPLTEDQLNSLNMAYNYTLPEFINIEKIGSRHCWYAQIYKASNPFI